MSAPRHERGPAPDLLGGFVPTDRGPRAAGRQRADVARSVAAGLLCVLVGVLAAVTVTAAWVRSQLLDTDRYVAAVGPLAARPAFQADAARFVADALAPALGGLPLTPEQRRAAEQEVRRRAGAYAGTAAFARTWVDVNRTGHTRVAAILRGADRPVRGTSVQDGVVVVDLTGSVRPVLGPLADEVRAATSGAVTFSVADVRLPVGVADVATLRRATPWVRLLERSAVVAPATGTAAAFLAVVLARRRLRMVAALATSVGVAMLALTAARTVGGRAVAGALDGRGLSPDVASVVVTRLSSVLRDDVVLVSAVATLVAVVAVAAVAVGAEVERGGATDPGPAPDDGRAGTPGGFPAR